MLNLFQIQEEKADLKTQLYLRDRENASLTLELEGKQLEIAAYRLQLQHLTHPGNDVQVTCLLGVTLLCFVSMFVFLCSSVVK